MTFTEMALFVWAIAASIFATHYWARFRAANTIVQLACAMQMQLLSKPAFYEQLRAKYLRDKAAGVV